LQRKAYNKGVFMRIVLMSGTIMLFLKK
jgi:hypothetical protein